MRAIGRQPQRAPDGAPLHYERRRPEQTMLYGLVQEHAASFIAHTETSTGSELPRFIKDEIDAFLECAILADGFLRLRCSEYGHDKLLAFSCKRRGFCPSSGASRVSQTAMHPVDHVIPHVPVRRRVLSLPITLRLLLASQPELITAVLQVVQRLLTRHLLGLAGRKADEGQAAASPCCGATSQRTTSTFTCTAWRWSLYAGAPRLAPADPTTACGAPFGRTTANKGSNFRLYRCARLSCAARKHGGIPPASSTTKMRLSAYSRSRTAARRLWTLRRWLHRFRADNKNL